MRTVTIYLSYFLHFGQGSVGQFISLCHVVLTGAILLGLQDPSWLSSPPCPSPGKTGAAEGWLGLSPYLCSPSFPVASLLLHNQTSLSDDTGF